MPYYRLYSFEGSRLVGAKEFHAADDIQAIRGARLIERTATCELWEGGRKVAMPPFKKAAASLRGVATPRV